MDVPFNKIITDGLLASSYVSNLSDTKGEVMGSSSVTDLDIFRELFWWVYNYDKTTGTLSIYRKDKPEEVYTIFSGVMKITEVSFSFNKTMNYFVVYKKEGLVYMYFYNPISTQYEESLLGDLETPKVALTSYHPDHRIESQTVIGYFNNKNELCLRLESDRFMLEHPIKKFEVKAKLFSMGYNTLNRFQYEVLEEA